MPVGIRGLARSQRFAACLAVVEIADRLSPEDLTDVASTCIVREAQGCGAGPGCAGPCRAHLWRRRGHRWGPGGSVGFEIATGVPTATASSDLDVILRQDQPARAVRRRSICTPLWSKRQPRRGSTCILETPRGGVSLADLAACRGRVLVRTPDGRPSCGRSLDGRR